MIKAIFFDVDGTLLSFSTHQMPKSARLALNKLRDKGVKVFVATGRPPISFKRILDKLDFDFDGFIYTNGQYIVYEGEVIHDMPLPEDDLKNIVEYIEENKIATSFSEMEYNYVNLTNKRMEDFMDLMGATIDNFKIDDVERTRKNPTYQISPYISVDEEEDFFAKAPNLKGVRWNEHFTDVIPKEGGKDKAIEKLINKLGIKKEECMAFGDGGNDADMLSYVGYGIAMGNAVDQAKLASDYVTASVDDDGIYKALVKYRVIEE